MTNEAARARREGLAELAEDAVGFGGQELRLTRDLLLRPRAVMDAYDAHGSTAGGLYPKPLRYYLTLMGLYLLAIALLGGFESSIARAFAQNDPEILGKMAAEAHKSEGALLADMDQWYALLSIPLFALLTGGGTFLLIRRWSPGPDRQDFRQTFTYLNAFNLLGIPVGLCMLTFQVEGSWPLVGTFLLMAITYARVGSGRWWRTPAGAIGKGLIFHMVLGLAAIVASITAVVLSIIGALVLP